MSSDRGARQRVQDIFDQARALPQERRAPYLDEACGDDRELRRAVESLLSSSETADDFLERRAAQVFDRLAATGLLEGRAIGPYQVGARVGAGGMGEVYQALDTRLARKVAIKILPAQLATDSQGHKRFEREARAVAALNHPHICTLYDIGAQDGINYLVIEFLEGETLASRLIRGPVPLAKALEYAAQIASALHAAHRAGIVHRDLKPGNVMLTPGGAKLLDFGLAKTRTHMSQADETASRELTRPGTILGTPQYMAPEQVEGKDADTRTDVFAFGAVLHEMLTGKKAFDAPTNARLAAAILSSHPPRVSQLAPAMPAFLDYVVGRCLAKEPDERWQTTRDLLAELERSLASLRSPGGQSLPEGSHAERDLTEPARTPRRAAIAIAIVGAAAVALAAALYGALSRPTPSTDVVWLSILPPPGGFDLSPDPVVSPDGRHVIYKAQDTSHRTHIWIKSLGSSDAHPIPGTDGTDFTVAAFWSPDNRSVGFFREGKLNRVDIEGGIPQVLAAAPEPRGGTWSSSGVIIFNADTQSLMRVPASGGDATRIADASDGGVRLFPHALPGGDRYLFTSRNAGGQGMGVYVGSLSSPDIHRVSDAWSPAVYANGHLLFARLGRLFAQLFDVNGQRVVGEPIAIADGVGLSVGTPLSFAFSASAGVVTYWGGSAAVTTQLTWFDRSGRRLSVASEPGLNVGFSVTQDVKRAALERGQDIWLLNLQRGAGDTRLTADGRLTVPVLTPSGDRLALEERGRGIVTMPVGGGATEVIVAGAPSKWPVAWSPDGRVLTFLDTTQTGMRIWTVVNRAGSQPAIYREAPFVLGAHAISPDGQWLAYSSNESGRQEVYVDSFPAPSARSRVSRGGGAWPRWRSDGKELFYLAPDRRLMSSGVVIGDAGSRAFASAVALFEGPGVNPDNVRMQFAPSPDGSRFLINARVEDPTPVGLTVIVNWPTLIKQ